MAGLVCPTPVSGLLYRGVSTPQVYVWEDGALHWIPDPQTFSTLGYNDKDVNVVPDECIRQQPIGAPLQAIANGASIPYLDYQILFGVNAPSSAKGQQTAATTPTAGLGGLTQAISAHPLLTLGVGLGAVWFLFGGRRRR